MARGGARAAARGVRKAEAALRHEKRTAEERDKRWEAAERRAGRATGARKRKRQLIVSTEGKLYGVESTIDSKDASSLFFGEVAKDKCKARRTICGLSNALQCTAHNQSIDGCG